MHPLDYVVLGLSLLMIVVTMLQESKDDIKDAFSGEKSELFKNQKTRGAELVLRRLTALTAAALVVCVFVVNYIR